MKVRCLNCGHEFDLQKVYYDKLGTFTVCPECDGSFDVDIPDKCMDWMKNIIKELLVKYENLETYTDCEEYRREGAVGILEDLLEIIDGN